MGFLDTIRRTLGFERPLVVKEPSSFSLTDAAILRLQSLPEDHALTITTFETGDGHGVRAVDGPTDAAITDATDGRLVMAPEDFQLLRGLQLDWRDGRWALILSLTVRARETPNPHGRLYLVDRALAGGPSLFFASAETAPPLATRLLGIEGVLTVLFRANTVTVARSASATWATIDRELDVQLREYFLSAGRALTAEDRPAGDDPLLGELELVLQENILPAVHRDGGDIVLLGITGEGVVQVQMTGACQGCPASSATLKQGVERLLVEAFPGRVTAVEAV